MRYVALFVTLLSYLFGVSGSMASNTDVQKALGAVRTDIQQLRVTAGLEQEIKVILSLPKTLGYSYLAWNQPYGMRNGKEVRAVFVRELFLKAATPVILEHVARHEICHLKNDDNPEKLKTIDTPEKAFLLEVEVEACVQLLVGVERYVDYIKAYYEWNPADLQLSSARWFILYSMGQTE